jgi:hypothetical protein
MMQYLSMFMMICPGEILQLQVHVAVVMFLSIDFNFWKAQLWRWFTAPFASQGLINVLIGMFVFGQMSAAFEVRTVEPSNSISSFSFCTLVDRSGNWAPLEWPISFFFSIFSPMFCSQ